MEMWIRRLGFIHFEAQSSDRDDHANVSKRDSSDQLFSVAGLCRTANVNRFSIDSRRSAQPSRECWTNRPILSIRKRLQRFVTPRPWTAARNCFDSVTLNSLNRFVLDYRPVKAG